MVILVLLGLLCLMLDNRINNPQLYTENQFAYILVGLICIAIVQMIRTYKKK